MKEGVGAAVDMTLDEANGGVETPQQVIDKPKEHVGRVGPDPVRYGDWENKGRCVDF